MRYFPEILRVVGLLAVACAGVYVQQKEISDLPPPHIEIIPKPVEAVGTCHVGTRYWLAVMSPDHKTFRCYMKDAP